MMNLIPQYGLCGSVLELRLCAWTLQIPFGSPKADTADKRLLRGYLYIITR